MKRLGTLFIAAGIIVAIVSIVSICSLANRENKKQTPFAYVDFPEEFDKADLPKTDQYADVWEAWQSGDTLHFGYHSFQDGNGENIPDSIVHLLVKSQFVYVTPQEAESLRRWFPSQDEIKSTK